MRYEWLASSVLIVAPLFMGCEEHRRPPERVVVAAPAPGPYVTAPGAYVVEPGYYYVPEYYDGHNYYHERVYYYYDGRQYIHRDSIPHGYALRVRPDYARERRR